MFDMMVVYYLTRVVCPCVDACVVGAMGIDEDERSVARDGDACVGPAFTTFSPLFSLYAQHGNEYEVLQTHILSCIVVCCVIAALYRSSLYHHTIQPYLAVWI